MIFFFSNTPSFANACFDDIDYDVDYDIEYHQSDKCIYTMLLIATPTTMRRRSSFNRPTNQSIKDIQQSPTFQPQKGTPFKCRTNFPLSFLYPHARSKPKNEQAWHSKITYMYTLYPLLPFYHLSIYLKSGKPRTISLITSSSSIFRLCAELVAPVSGCLGGGVTGRGGGRANGSDGAGAGPGVSKKDHGSEGSGCCDGAGAAVEVGTEDSKMEKSAVSAHAAVESWVGGGGEAGAGGGV